MTALYRFVALYALMYAAFGVSSPFLPAFFAARGLTPVQIGIALRRRNRDPARIRAARRADCRPCARAPYRSRRVRRGGRRCRFCDAAGTRVRAVVRDEPASRGGAGPDHDTGRRARPLGGRTAHIGLGFEYGWVRGTGSSTFIAGTLVSGQVVGAWGLGAILVLQGAFLVAAAAGGLLVPEARAGGCERRAGIARERS